MWLLIEHCKVSWLNQIHAYGPATVWHLPMNVSDKHIGESFAATFMLLDKLGVSASRGVTVVCKQAFFGFWFSLLDGSHSPTPSYWVARIYKLLVGRKVLNITTVLDITTPLKNESYMRVYCHCTSARSGYKPGSVVLYLMNLANYTVHINFTNMPSTVDVYQYLLTAHGQNVTSSLVDLNGHVLKMPDDRHLPEMKSILISHSEYTDMPSKSLAFYIFSGANITKCNDWMCWTVKSSFQFRKLDPNVKWHNNRSVNWNISFSATAVCSIDKAIILSQSHNTDLIS